MVNRICLVRLEIIDRQVFRVIVVDPISSSILSFEGVQMLCCFSLLDFLNRGTTFHTVEH